VHNYVTDDLNALLVSVGLSCGAEVGEIERFCLKMSSPDPEAARRKAPKQHKKIVWPTEYAECPESGSGRYAGTSGKTLESRPRSATPTMHGRTTKERHRARVSESN